MYSLHYQLATKVVRNGCPPVLVQYSPHVALRFLSLKILTAECVRRERENESIWNRDRLSKLVCPETCLTLLIALFVRHRMCTGSRPNAFLRRCAARRPGSRVFSRQKIAECHAVFSGSHARTG